MRGGFPRRATGPLSEPCQFGAISFVKQFGATLNEHWHYHCYVVDVLFCEDPQAGLRFAEIQLDADQMAAVQSTVRRRMLAAYRRRGWLDAAAAPLRTPMPGLGASARSRRWRASGLPAAEARSGWATQIRLTPLELIDRRAKFIAPPRRHLHLQCPRCGGAMRLLAFIIERATIVRILSHLGKACVVVAGGGTRRA